MNRKKSNLKTFFVHHRSPHHAKNSGYKRILDYYPQAIEIRGNTILPYKLARLFASFHNQKAGLYNSDSFFKELELYSHLRKIKQETSVVHFLNAERDIRYVVKHSGLFPNTSFCATFHKPPKILSKAITNIKYLKKLNGAIAVGENQVEFLQNWLNLDKVKYIPHGVDVDFFSFDLKKRKPKNLIFVGQHLRDFETFNYCIPILAEKIKGLNVNVVLRKDFYHKINPHACINFYSNITDNKLRSLYSEANALFLPLLDATACNSILEAMACGLPIITTEVGGIPEYLKNTLNIMLPLKESDGLIDNVVDLLGNEQRIINVGASSRKKSLLYDWRKIAAEIQHFHRNLANV